MRVAWLRRMPNSQRGVAAGPNALVQRKVKAILGAAARKRTGKTFLAVDFDLACCYLLAIWLLGVCPLPPLCLPFVWLLPAVCYLPDGPCCCLFACCV